MRLSLLFDREDAASIISATLAQYLQVHTGRSSVVWWGSGRGGRGSSQVWYGNRYLNYFAVGATRRRDLAVVRREFARSRSAWRRPLQRLYVECATLPVLRRLLATETFSVSPGMEGARGWLLVPGNHRMRLLRPDAGRSIVILKAGFARRYISAEVSVRQDCAQPLAPRLREIAREGNWFEEEYIEAVPINRLPPSREQALRAHALDRLSALLIHPTVEQVSASRWAAALHDAVAEEIRSNCSRIQNSTQIELLELARRLRSLVDELAPRALVATARTHGDFQCANILHSSERIWLIDWELTARRLATYDLFCLGWDVRLRSDWGARLRELERDEALWSRLQSWPGCDWGRVPRRAQVALFALEELRLELPDAVDVNFRNTAARVERLRDRFAIILNEVSGP